MHHENNTHYNKLSPRDKSILNREIHDETTVEKAKHVYDEVIIKLNEVIGQYFPDVGLPEASFDIFKTSYEDGLKAFNSDEEYTFENNYNQEAFISAVTVRYIDDFIDTKLWPQLAEFDKKILNDLFGQFLEKSLEVIQILYDVSLPSEIIRLPQLELQLALNPTQENFDKHIHDLIYYKSFDLAYLKQKIFSLKENLRHINPLEYEQSAFNDLARDFYYNSYQFEKDFNLKNFIEEHNIDPQILIDNIKKSFSLDDHFTKEMIGDSDVEPLLFGNYTKVAHMLTVLFDMQEKHTIRNNQTNTKIAA